MAKKKDEGQLSEEIVASTPEEKAAAFFEEQTDYHLASVFVTDDLTVFHGDLKGENTAINYTKAHGGKYYKFEK